MSLVNYIKGFEISLSYSKHRNNNRVYLRISDTRRYVCHRVFINSVMNNIVYVRSKARHDHDMLCSDHTDTDKNATLIEFANKIILMCLEQNATMKDVNKHDKSLVDDLMSIIEHNLHEGMDIYDFDIKPMINLKRCQPVIV